MNVLITGGMGFVASHLAGALAAEGERVSVLDNLDPQVHGRRSPRRAARGVRTVVGDVHDIVQACRLALRKKQADHRVFNVGTGTTTPVTTLAEALARACRSGARPKILRKFRSGDIRHCYADITAISKALGYRPRVSLQDGLAELVEWSGSAEARDDFERAQGELTRRGLA